MPALRWANGHILERSYYIYIYIYINDFWEVLFIDKHIILDISPEHIVYIKQFHDRGNYCIKKWNLLLAKTRNKQKKEEVLYIVNADAEQSEQNWNNGKIKDMI